MRAPYLKTHSRREDEKSRFVVAAPHDLSFRSLVQKNARVGCHKVGLGAHVLLVAVVQRRQVAPGRAAERINRSRLEISACK